MIKRKDQGYTMIIVMCLMFLFMALALSMLFSSAMLLARAERSAAQKQSRASAVSFMEWMEKSLAEPPAGGDNPSNLSGHVKKRIEGGGWPSYSPGNVGHEAAVATRTFTPVSPNATSEFPNDKVGDLEVQMYWETEDGGTDPNDPDVELVVTVKAVVRNEQYSVTTRYNKTQPDEAEGSEWDGTWNVGGRE